MDERRWRVDFRSLNPEQELSFLKEKCENDIYFYKNVFDFDVNKTPLISSYLTYDSDWNEFWRIFWYI